MTITQYASGHYALLVMVGDGGSVKYDSLIETQVVRLIALSNKVAIITSAEAAAFARRHGRPRSTDLHKFQQLLQLIRSRIKREGIEKELDDAREEVHRLRKWLGSRRQLAPNVRRQEGGKELVFAGPRFSRERLA